MSFQRMTTIGSIPLSKSDAIAWSTLPLLVYFALRRYLQGLGVVRPIMITLIVANLMNVAGNWLLIYGNLGAPALGVAGSAWRRLT